MHKRKRGIAILLTVILVAVVVVLVVVSPSKDKEVLTNDKKTEDSNSSEETVSSEAAPGDIYTIQEYNSPSVSEVLSSDVVDPEEKASQLYLYGTQKLITDLYEKAAEYYDAALEVDGISSETRAFLLDERYRLSVEAEFTDDIEKFKKLLDEANAG